MAFVMDTTARQPWEKADIQWWHTRLMIRCYGWTFATGLQGTPRFDSCCAGNGYVDRGTPGTTVSHLLSFPCASSVFPGALFPISLLFSSPLKALTLFLTSQLSTHLTTNLAFTLWLHCHSVLQSHCDSVWARKLSWVKQSSLVNDNRESWTSSSVEG